MAMLDLPSTQSVDQCGCIRQARPTWFSASRHMTIAGEIWTCESHQEQGWPARCLTCYHSFDLPKEPRRFDLVEAVMILMIGIQVGLIVGAFLS